MRIYRTTRKIYDNKQFIDIKGKEYSACIDSVPLDMLKVIRYYLKNYTGGERRLARRSTHLNRAARAAPSAMFARQVTALSLPSRRSSRQAAKRAAPCVSIVTSRNAP